MAAATVQLQVATGAGPAFVSGEGGYKYSREDTLAGTTPIPIPFPGPGTNYSWLKWLCLAVTVVGTTNINNRRIQLSVAEAAGLGVFFQGNGTYAQAAGGNQPGASGSNGPATPAGFTRATTTNQVYDNSTVATSGLGRNGTYCETVLGVDATAAVGANPPSAIPIPDIKLAYDEAVANVMFATCLGVAALVILTGAWLVGLL